MLQYRNQTSQAILLVGPFVLPRSFLAPSVMLGILMKWYSLNQPTSFLMKWLAITMIVLHLSSKAFLGWAESTFGVVTLFSPAIEVCAKLFRHILWKNVRRVDGGITEVKHTQILFLFGSSINLYSATRLLLPLMAGRIFFVRIGCCRVALASVMLFKSGIGIGNGMRCTIHEGVLFILPWSACLGIIPRINNLGSNGTRHDRNSGHGSLMQVDLGAKRCQDR
jgi:hypothetical protein